MNLRSLAALAAPGLTGALLLAGCGSSSKPAYCTQVNNFKESVKTLEEVELSPTNLGTIKTDVEKVGTSAKELKTAVGTEFEPQITAMENSVEALGTTVKSVAKLALDLGDRDRHQRRRDPDRSGEARRPKKCRKSPRTSAEDPPPIARAGSSGPGPG